MRWFHRSIRRAARSARYVFAPILAIGLVLVWPIEADADVRRAGKSGGDRTEVSFEITGYRCSVETVRERTTRNGRKITRLVESGPTVSSIPLMTGELTVRSTTVVGRSGAGRIFGSWTLEPEGSTGSIRGRFGGSIAADGTAEVRSVGRGRRALRGVSVVLHSTARPAAPEGEPGAPCKADVILSGSGTASGPAVEPPVGAVIEESTKSFGDTVADLTSTIDANPNLTLIKTVDHSAGAAGRDLTLPPTTELFFGNPAIGTPLMQASQTTGIDLPQKMLVWEDLFGIVRVGYNGSSYLGSRHDIVGADQQLTTVANALAALAGAATGSETTPVLDGQTVGRGAGLITITTDRSADEAFAAIVAALEAAPPINVVFTLEHDANAARIGAELRPTKLVVFGNPSLGTPLMQTERTVALDLPQKILVYTDADGQTMIAYNDPQAVARRHRLRGQNEILETIRGALANFAAVGG